MFKTPLLEPHLGADAIQDQDQLAKSISNNVNQASLQVLCTGTA